jgi:hypothetical protein
LQPLVPALLEPGCAPAAAAAPRVCLVAVPEAATPAELAAAELRTDGHDVQVVTPAELAALAGAEAVLVIGGLELEAAARAVAPAHAYVHGELLEGQGSTWSGQVLRAARAVAIAAAPARTGSCA